MNPHCRLIFPLALLLLALPQAIAQGTLADYQRAQQFLPGNLRHLVYVADVFPHWIEKTNRFWYRKAGPEGSGHTLVAEFNIAATGFRRRCRSRAWM